MPNVIHLPCVGMRGGPSEDARVISQALFGEEVRPQKTSGDWVLVRTPDEYSGWVKTGSFAVCERPCRPDLEVSRLQAHVYCGPDTAFGPLLTLPFGSKLEEIEGGDVRWCKVLLPDRQAVFIQRGDVEAEPFDLANFSKKFLGLPYTWGGRSSFGFDCSGFVQMLYSRLGIQLPRDARQQIARGRPLAIEKLELGDLIFWGKSETEIGHVGMFLQEKELIHTSARENKPYLRISQLTDPEWRGEQRAYYPFRTARRIL